MGPVLSLEENDILNRFVEKVKQGIRDQGLAIGQRARSCLPAIPYPRAPSASGRLDHVSAELVGMVAGLVDMVAELVPLPIELVGMSAGLVGMVAGLVILPDELDQMVGELIAKQEVHIRVRPYSSTSNLGKPELTFAVRRSTIASNPRTYGYSNKEPCDACLGDELAADL